MIFNLINGGLVLVGGLIGILIGNFLPKKMSDTLMKAIALGVMYIGISTMLTEANVLVVLICLTVGVIIGELLKIEDGINKLGEIIEAKANKSSIAASNEAVQNNYNLGVNGPTENNKNSATDEAELNVNGHVLVLADNSLKSKPKMEIAVGFVTATILFCSGSMAIVGSLQAGIVGDGSTLLAKSILDGVMALIYATSMGFGVLLSAVPLILYQGIFVILASSLSGLMTTAAIATISSVGGIIIFAIGIKLMFDIKIRIASFIPAVFIPIVLSLFELI